MRLSLLTDGIGEEIGPSPTTVLLRAKAVRGCVRVLGLRPRRGWGVRVRWSTAQWLVFAEDNALMERLIDAGLSAMHLRDEQASWSGVQLTGSGGLSTLERCWRGRLPSRQQGQRGHCFGLNSVLLHRDEAVWELYWPYSAAFMAWRQLRNVCPSHTIGVPL